MTANCDTAAMGYGTLESFGPMDYTKKDILLMAVAYMHGRETMMHSLPNLILLLL